MEIRNLILEIAKGWKSFHSVGKDDRDHPIHSLVVREFPTSLKQAAENSTEMMFEGSVGQGNLTAAPWVACFHTSLTTSAQDEYYVVYLFSVDMELLVLELGFGITQFQSRFGRSQKSKAKLRAASLTMQQLANKHREHCFAPELNDRVRLGAADLRASGVSRLHEGYEQGAIFHVSYTLADLPAEDRLVADLNQFLRLYRELAEDPTVPGVGDIAWADAKAPAQLSLFPVTDFEPRDQPNAKRGLHPSQANHNRRSKIADKIGREAEEHVVKYECKKLTQLKKPELASKVVWHRDASGNRTPGWDITSYNEQGHKIFIEVKGSVDKTIGSINLTRNEWQKAQAEQVLERYRIYLVTEALSNPKIEILRNPAQWVDDGKLEIVISDYQLNLRSLS